MEREDRRVESQWDCFSRWICCVGVVTFDLELGQALEFVFPSHFKLSDAEKLNLCYLAFPDSNSGCMGDSQFHFRIKCSGVGCGGAPPQQPFVHKASQPALEASSSHYFGFVYFRQMRDPTNKRGYFQKSVVLLTRLPYTKLFSHLVKLIAPEYFDNGEVSLESACYDIDRWPVPIPGKQLQLPVMGTLVRIQVPSKQDKLPVVPSQSAPAPSSLSLSSVYEVDMYRLLYPVVPYIHLIWELVLLNEPIAIMAPSPDICSEVVQALVNSIMPLRYSSDYRPFFTIHDSEFKAYTTKTQSPPSVIVGVTNPFFIKALQHWPHILRLGELALNEKKGKKQGKNSSAAGALEAKPGLFTLYKAFLDRDKVLLQALWGKSSSSGKKKPLAAQNAILRRHLLELTESFIIPLERYVTSLMPLQRHISPWRAIPSLKPFDLDAFLKSVAHAGPQLTTGQKGNWVGLYKAFSQSINFREWLKVRQDEANARIRALYVDALCKADLGFWMKDKSEIEVVDFLIKIRGLLKSSSGPHSLSPLQQSLLSSQVDSLVQNLPDDLQRTLMMT
ncbi:protein DENND6B-like [Oscarella lobularis]|uniref:protein DENND6B-like n=1 Tax=Oscarella lobularis TaxID=121494 RepID=UPI003313255C